MSEERPAKAQDMGRRRGALGKGFNSLLQINDPEVDLPGTNSERGSGLVELPVTSIEPNPHQPRKLFKEQSIRELTESIKQDGIIQPLIAKKGDQPGKYILIAGERRWRAAQKAGLKSVPVIVRERAPEEMLRVALIENIQRSDLSVIEEAEAYASLIRDFGLTQEQCSQKVGKERSSVANALRLLSLPKELQNDLMEGRLSMGHGRALLSLGDKKAILKARDIVVKKKLSVRQTESLCKSLLKQGDSEGKEKSKKGNADLEYLAENLRNRFRTKVRLSGTGSRGKIELSYFSASELERIVALLGLEI